MSPMRSKSGIPDRWLDYTAVGKRLKGTRFVAFKVPLKKALTQTLPSSQAFGPWELLEALRGDKQELGLIIDLTFTSRYYRLQDVPQSLLCVKILTAGHTVPSDETILSFKRAVHQFLRDNKDNDTLIGVHCTHGLNRTGYLICRYLIDVDGMAPAEAIHLFNSSRGHAIERQNYLEDLKYGPKRSNEGIEESEQEPHRGQAVHRPTFTSSSSFSEPGSHRSPRGQRSEQRSYLPPPPPAHPPSASFQPYMWTAHPPDAQCSRPPDSERNRFRPRPHPGPEWHPSFASFDRGGAPAPLYPRYSVANGDASADNWRRPEVRHQVRSSQRPRASGYHHY